MLYTRNKKLLVKVLQIIRNTLNFDAIDLVFVSFIPNNIKMVHEYIVGSGCDIHLVGCCKLPNLPTIFLSGLQ